MTLTKRNRILAVAGIMLTAAAVFCLPRLLAPSAVIGDCKYTLASVRVADYSSLRGVIEGPTQPHSGKQIWIKIRVDALGAYRDQWGYPPWSIYGPSINTISILRNARLVTPQGKLLLPKQAYADIGTYIWDDLAHHPRPHTNFAVYQFDAPSDVQKVTFEGDVYRDTSPPNTFPQTQQWPFVGTLKFDNISVL